MVSYLKALREKNLRNRMKTWCLQSLETWESLREFQVCQMKTHSSILTWENFMDRGAWWASIHGVAKSQTQRSMHARRHRILKKKYVEKNGGLLSFSNLNDHTNCLRNCFIFFSISPNLIHYYYFIFRVHCCWQSPLDLEIHNYIPLEESL